MIAKSKVGRSFGGTIRYLFEGHKGEQTDKMAELIDYNGIRPDKDKMIKDFDRHRWLRPGLGNAVGHIITSYHVDDSDKVDNGIIAEHAKRIMIGGGIDPDNTQYAVVLHRDRDHIHAHTVYNRVDFDGRTIKDNLIGVKVTKTADRIAREYGLTIAAEKKKDLKLTHRERLPGDDKVRYEIYEALTKELASATSIDKLRKALQKGYGIETKVQKNGEGMSFKKGIYAFKASEIDRSLTGKKIHAQIALNADKWKEEMLAHINAVNRFQSMSPHELQTFFNQVGKGELKPSKTEVDAINDLMKVSPEVRQEYQKYQNGQAESREKEITERLNRFYYGVGAAGPKKEYRGMNTLGFVGSVRQKGQIGFVAEYLAKDFADPRSAAEKFEKRLDEDYEKGVKAVGAPYTFVREWANDRKNQESASRKLFADSDQWQNRLNSPLSQDQRAIVDVLKIEAEYYQGTRPMKHSRGQKQ